MDWRRGQGTIPMKLETTTEIQNQQNTTNFLPDPIKTEVKICLSKPIECIHMSQNFKGNTKNLLLLSRS